MAVISEYGQLLVILACIFGFLMAWGVGANDVANAMGTSVGSKALTIKQAILIAMVFEFAGAYLAGGAVTGTIRKPVSRISMFSSLCCATGRKQKSRRWKNTVMLLRCKGTEKQWRRRLVGGVDYFKHILYLFLNGCALLLYDHLPAIECTGRSSKTEQ